MRVDKKISWGMTLLTAMMLQACGGGGGGSTVATPPPVVQGAVQTAPSAVAITLADQQQIQAVEDVTVDPLADNGSRVKMTFAHPSAALAAVPVGQVLLFGQDANFPEGYAGRVTAIQPNADGSVAVSFGRVALTDVFSDLKIEATPENSALINPRVYVAPGMEEFVVKKPAPALQAGAFGVDGLNVSGFQPTVGADGLNQLHPTIKYELAVLDVKGKKGEIDAFSGKKCDDADLKLTWGKGDDRKFASCMEVSVSFTVNINKLKHEKSTIDIKDSSLKEYSSRMSAEVDAAIGLTAEVKALRGQKFDFSLLGAIRKMLKNKAGLKTSDPQDAKDGVAKFENWRLEGVPYDDDKLVLATVVYDLTKVATGPAALDAQVGKREIQQPVSVYLSVFVKSAITLDGYAQLTASSPKFRFDRSVHTKEVEIAGVKVLQQVDDGSSSSFDQIQDGAITLNAGAGVDLHISAGADLSVGIAGIVPANWTILEAGFKLGGSGMYTTSTDGTSAGCWSGGTVSVGARSFLDVGAELKYERKPGKDWSVLEGRWHLGPVRNFV